ncbi:Uncharacterised protein [Mycobacteroides abscessus subsp. massiliense]|nr:Uncharacterised protein [Mycobacteroides abscessus subsp. massiliense]SKU82244.1 Uncharacterised protein [Mycobacteroides abscessus subsp. massiliense]
MRMIAELAGFVIQMVGAGLTAWGLFVAWRRASGRFTQWHNRIDQFRLRLASRPTKRDGDNLVEPQAGTLELAGGVPGVIIAPADPAERLEYALKVLARLDSRIDDRIQAALDAELAELGETENLVKLSDIYWALGGVVVSAGGFFIEHVPMLVKYICRCA